MFRRYLFLIVLVGLFALVASSCGGSDDKGDGFKPTKTDPTKATLPSDTPTLSQPCSLVSIETASTILDVPQDLLDDPESSEPSEGTLRCRYSAISADSTLFLVLNVYVYTTQDAYDSAKEFNKGIDIETSVDGGFTFENTTTTESERFVAARDGGNRIGVSASIAITDPDEELTPDQITLPDVNELADQVGTVLFKLQ